MALTVEEAKAVNQVAEWILSGKTGRLSMPAFWGMNVLLDSAQRVVSAANGTKQTIREWKKRAKQPGFFELPGEEGLAEDG